MANPRHKDEYARLREQLRQERPQRLPPVRVAPPPAPRKGEGGSQLAAALLQTAAGIIQGGAKAAMQYGVQTGLQEQQHDLRMGEIGQQDQLATARAKVRSEHELAMAETKRGFETEQQKNRLQSDLDKIREDFLNKGWLQKDKYERMWDLFDRKWERKHRRRGGDGTPPTGPRGKIYEYDGKYFEKSKVDQALALLRNKQVKAAGGGLANVAETQEFKRLLAISGGTTHKSWKGVRKANDKATISNPYSEAYTGSAPTVADPHATQPAPRLPEATPPPAPEAEKAAVKAAETAQKDAEKRLLLMQDRAENNGYTPGTPGYNDFPGMEKAVAGVTEAQENRIDTENTLQEALTARAAETTRLQGARAKAISGTPPADKPAGPTKEDRAKYKLLMEMASDRSARKRPDGSSLTAAQVRAAFMRLNKKDKSFKVPSTILSD